MTEQKMNEIFKFINEGIIELDFSHDNETIGYVNATKEIKVLYINNSFSKFISLLQDKFDELNAKELLSYRLQGRKLAYEDVINEIKRLEKKEDE